MQAGGMVVCDGCGESKSPQSFAARPLSVLLLLDDPSEAVTHDLRRRLAEVSSASSGRGSVALQLSVNVVPPLPQQLLQEPPSNDSRVDRF